jgi:hypothetical protein
MQPQISKTIATSIEEKYDSKKTAARPILVA